MADIRVRAQEASDLAAITALYACPGVIRGTLQLPFRSEGERREQFERRLPGFHLLVAELDGRVIGQCGLQVQQSPRRRHAGDLGMAVHDDYTGRGVGGALLVATLDLAERWLGLRRIQLEVYTDNAAAIALYHKHGFVREGTLRGFAFRDGDYVDAYLMARRSHDRDGAPPAGTG
jgi:putative acetyltransferase